MAGGRADKSPLPWRAIAFWILVGILCLPVTGFVAAGLGARIAGYGYYSIPAASMSPTIESGDRIMAAPLGGADAIRRGDIVFFRLPQDPTTIFVKRVIGLPGDHVRIEDGVIVVNDVPFRAEADGDDRRPRRESRNQVCDSSLSSETRCVKSRFHEAVPASLGPQLRYAIVRAGGAYSRAQADVATPAGHLFVMGDNRDNSRDSRAPGGIGFVPTDNVLYRNGFIWYSSGGGVSRWLTSIAPDETAASN